MQFKVFASSGACVITARLTADALAADEHLAPVLSSVREAMTASPGRFELTVCVEGTTPIGLWWKRVQRGIGFGVLDRANRQAILIVVPAGGGTVDGGKLRQLAEQLEAAHTGVSLTPAVDWLTGVAPPIAAMVYCSEGPTDIGLDTVGMLVATVAAADDTPDSPHPSVGR